MHPDIDQALAAAGFDDPTDRQELRLDIETTAQDLAISKLIKAGKLADAEKAVIRGVFKTKDQPRDTLSPIFATPHGQQAYQEALAEALKLVADAAASEG